MSETSKENFKPIDTLCERIDSTLLEFFKVLTDLYREQALLEERMKSGYFNMSRSRYSMGIKNVGIQQCDTNNMAAVVKVGINENEDLFLENISNVHTAMEKLQIKSDESKTQSSNVRRRNVKTVTDGGDVSTDDDSNKSGVEEIKASGKETRQSSPVDPLKWFGVLIPPALRQSQTDFRHCLHSIVTIANLKKRLDCLRKQYRELLSKKKEFV